MAHNYHTKLPHKQGYPGDGYYYVICDICGKKIRAKDAVIATDILHKNLLVCQDDVDVDNPQTYVRAVRERNITNPKVVRGESPDNFEFISDPSEIETGDVSDPTGAGPEAPEALYVRPDSSTVMHLFWEYNGNAGAGEIIGYKIERESPEGGGFSTVTSNTNSVARFYEDVALSANTEYNYRVSAVTKIGTSSASNEAKATTLAS